MIHPFERTVCDCAKCCVGCKVMPGTVAPGELEAIADYLGVQCNAAFVTEFFEASDGPQVLVKREGEIHITKVPTIVPKLTATGCIFLVDGKCSIHPVSPFGCSMHRACVTETDGDRKSKYLVNIVIDAHLAGTFYSRAWNVLMTDQRESAPLAERRRAYIAELDKLDARATADGKC